MSGFEYHLVCPRCRLFSGSYPPGGRPMFTGRWGLPVSNQRSQRFEVLNHPCGKESALEIAQRLSGPGLFISVPMNIMPPTLKPELPCPRCEEPAVSAVSGHGQAARFDSIDAVVVPSRLMAPYTTIAQVRDDGAVLVELSIELKDDQRWVLWEVEADTEAIRDAFLEELRSTLISTGSALGRVELSSWSTSRFYERRSM